MPETPSGYLPDYRISALYPPRILKRYKTEVEIARTGEEQRAIVGKPRRLITAKTIEIDPAGQDLVLSFLDAQYGQYGAFYAYHPVPSIRTNFAVGTVAGSSFIAPFKGRWWINETAQPATITSVTVNGSPAAFTVTPNIGPGGEDRINFSTPQAGSVVVTGSNLRERLVVRNLTDDSDDREWVPNAAAILARFPVALIELV